MSTHLGDLLDTARRQRFVGRHRELASFDDALAGRSPRRVLFVHGQGGIGKTTLLQEFRARARAAGRSVVQVDGRDVDPSPEGLRDGRPARRRPSTTDAPTDRAAAGRCGPARRRLRAAHPDRRVAARRARPRPERRHRRRAGRPRPARPRRGAPTPDGGSSWPCIASTASTRPKAGNCSPTPAWHRPLRPHLVTLGRGHPLTMALLADLAASGEVPDTLADAPDLISALLESFLRDVPSEAHLTGLATCAIAWLTTEDLLAQLVGADAAAVWQWLARRPFITAGPRGLFAHDLARDVLDAEFERRAPERYRAYRRIIYAHAVAGLRAATGLDRQLHAQQLFFLLRNSPLASAVSALRARGSATVVPARPDDHDQVCAIIEQFEGPASAELARAWLGEQPEHLSVVRTGDGVAGFAYHVLCPSGSALEDRDPVVRAVLDHVAREGPLRPGERVDIVRFFAGAREHQRDPYALLAGTVSSLIEMADPPARVVGPRRRRHRIRRTLLRLHGLHPTGRNRLRRPATRRLRHRLAPPPGRRLARSDARTRARPGKPDHHRPRCSARHHWTAPASPRRSRQPCRPCTDPTNSPPTRSSAPRWPPPPPGPTPTNSGPPSKTPSHTSATNPKATNSGPSCTAPTCAPPPPRKPPPKSSTCP